MSPMLLLGLVALLSEPAGARQAVGVEPGLPGPSTVDPDIALIPKAVTADRGKADDDLFDAGRTLETRVYVEDVFSASDYRHDLAIPLPTPPGTNWLNRFSLDTQVTGAIASGLSFTVSNRIDLYAPRDADGQDGATVGNNIKELYLTLEPGPGLFIEMGRINLKNGAASTFNPTDFFRANSRIVQASQDPAALRENRLGAVMLRVQTLWRGGSAVLAIAPKLASQRSLTQDTGPGFATRIDETNGTTRALLSITQEFWGLSPKFFLFSDDGLLRVGASATKPIGKSVVLSAEWAMGRRRDLLDDALCFGSRVGDLPAQPFEQSCARPRRLRQELAVSLNWVPLANLEVSAEYDYNGGGLSPQRWAELTAAPSSRLTQARYWYLQAYAGALQNPVFRHGISIRVAQSKAFNRNLNLAALALINASDGSLFGQASADYELSRNWSLGLTANATMGARNSVYAGLPQKLSGAIRLKYFF
ncbi:hypothetical protein LWE61_11805 [Sphingobium sufflavum]|uniref:hypothetical protein n=1 Tax=Sphingobium sufflavum TaxID=1129547 RepID=UPI001F1A11E0|nr:hypothetical protein [Sphingobium sufflavum]MCE7797242.1 hypothetical protein [Sphingobium sufflavum]